MTLVEALRSSALGPREARLLLAAASGLSEAHIAAFPEEPLPASSLERFAEYAERRARGEPVAYIVGCKEFYSMELAVTPAVLIPRPETELLVELAVRMRPASVLDLGTGSGAIALAIKRALPGTRVVAVESSTPALDVARANGARHALDVDWRLGSWFEPVGGERFELIVSNPPYVAEGDPHLAALRYEPTGALVSGAQGLDAIRDITGSARGFLEAGGWLVVEQGHDQAEAVGRLFAAGGLEQIATWPDLAGIPRITGGRR